MLRLGLAAVLGALLRADLAGAVPVDTFVISLDVQADAFCIEGTFANTTYDVFGTMVNLGTQAGGYVCTGNSMGYQCDSYPVAGLFTFGGPPAAMVSVPPPGTISFVSDQLTVTGSVAQAIGPVSYTLDGLVFPAGNAAPSGIPGCTLPGPVVAHFTGQGGHNAFQSEPTSAGTNVTVSSATTFLNPISGLETMTVALNFSTVTVAGDTTVTASSNAAAALSNSFAASFGGYQAAFLDVTTTASFSGPVTLCTTYADANDDGIIDGTTVPEGVLALLHEEGNPLAFVDHTSSRDPVNNVICATVSGFSHFVTVVRTSAVCSLAGAPCDDGDACTTADQCDGTLTCVGTGAPPSCDDGHVCTVDSCVSPSGCRHDPAPACLTADKSMLLIKAPADETKDKLLWKWIKGAALTQPDLADPTSSTDYALCVYSGTANALIAEAALPHGTSWSAVGSKGYKFKGTSPDGLTNATLSGDAAGKSKALAKGKGTALPDPTLPLAYPVTVQLRKVGSPLCLESSFTSADEKKNDAAQFKAKH